MIVVFFLSSMHSSKKSVQPLDEDDDEDNDKKMKNK